MLIGTSIAVPKGKDVGGDFASVPPCRSASQTGCLISFASFRHDVPPPPTTWFGRVADAGSEAVCTNPANLSNGGDAPLEAYLSARAWSTSTTAPGPWVKDGPGIETAYVKVPGLLTGKCVTRDNANYLAITVHGDPDDPRTDEIAGDILKEGQPDPFWGLHLIDVNLTIGNLTKLVKQQAATTRTAKR